MAKQVRVTKKEEVHREAAKQAAREAILEFQKQEDEGPDESIFEQLDHSNQTILAQAAGENQTNLESFDLFDYCDELQAKGTLVQYTIKKNNVLIASSVPHPLSWDLVMKKYGEGLYQVLAKNVATKKFIKSQTQMLGAVDVDTLKEEESSTQSQANFGVMEMMTMLERKAHEARREAREESQRMSELQEKQQTNMLSLITALVVNKPQGPSQAEIQLQTMQMMTQMLDKLQSNTNSMIERLSSKIEKVAETATQKKDDGPSWADVMKMTVEAQNKGFDMWTKLEELAEKKAEERMELIEEYRGEGEEKESKPESATDSLIKTILPTVVSALAGSGQAGAAAANQHALQQQRFLAQRNESLRIQEARQKEALRREATKREMSKVVQDSVPTPPVTGTVSGLPKVQFQEEEKPQTYSNPIKQKCLEVLPPFLGQLMIEASQGTVQGDEVITATINFLAEHDISVGAFVDNVESQDLIQVAEGYNLPDAAKVWLNELYAGIEKVYRAIIGAESTASLS
jgi:hypothetical protein